MKPRELMRKVKNRDWGEFSSALLNLTSFGVLAAAAGMMISTVIIPEATPPITFKLLDTSNRMIAASTMINFLGAASRLTSEIVTPAANPVRIRQLLNPNILLGLVEAGTGLASSILSRHTQSLLPSF